MNDQTTMTILDSIAHRVRSLYETVREYESDTFSAEAVMLTDDEAVDITCALIESALESLIDLDTLDGMRLSEELENIRD